MKKFNLILSLFVIALTFSCAESKTFELKSDNIKKSDTTSIVIKNGLPVFSTTKSENITETITVEPYGLITMDNKIKGIKYNANVGNIVLSIIFCETVIVPVWLCGWELFEPVSLDSESVEIIDGKIVRKSN